ncbi:uncharacterized protein BT62DRAFT_1011502 [Guyanagaster necrorhizus]|uniref:Uncharacterized protein n=1 Tax=Guyanagaster necrorhizus TaxID=856835 RepID=A0A9P8AMQ1_9AGAR|nr:uncharacterized protein BT62DRAFT_1011502 [Guyanagaster necrorhizus MCA 3950]KAG7441483.1 hypothetical protein BT62DRAFT_1011502 [Guyanagaster necrorhizus MCA 3950]
MANSSEEQLRVWAAEAFYWITSSESTSRRTCLVSIIGTRSCPNINQYCSVRSSEQNRSARDSCSLRLRPYIREACAGDIDHSSFQTVPSSSSFFFNRKHCCVITHPLYESKVSRANIAHEHMDLSPDRNGILSELRLV